jgi:hypothetical protein
MDKLIYYGKCTEETKCVRCNKQYYEGETLIVIRGKLANIDIYTHLCIECFGYEFTNVAASFMVYAS